MIVGILNGYYRSGTTIWQKVVEDCNENVITLHEPASPVLLPELRQRRDVNPIHGWNVYAGYFKLPRRVLAEFVRRWSRVRPAGIIVRWEDVVELLEPLHECRQPIFIKSNQFHLFLDKIEDRFGCRCVHMVRNLPDNVYAHVEIYPNEHFRRRVLLSRSYNDCFFVDSVHTLLCKHLNEKPAKNVLEKLIFNIRKCNELANAQKVRYEKPEEVEKVIRKMGLKVRKVKPIVGIAPEWLLRILS